MKDGDNWVTEEEYHRRRGEQLVDGKWVRVGEKEGKDWHEALTTSRVRTTYLWSANVDALLRRQAGARQARRRGRGGRLPGVLPDARARPPRPTRSGVPGRIRLHLFDKLPAYARLRQVVRREGEAARDLIKGWLPAVRRQHSFWWVDPIGVVGVYKFPNTPRTFVSNAVHNMGLILLTRYRFNYRFPRVVAARGLRLLPRDGGARLLRHVLAVARRHERGRGRRAARLGRQRQVAGRPEVPRGRGAGPAR